MMYFDKNGHKRFNEDVLTCLANEENDKVLFMLKDTDLSELVDCDGRTLLHYAAFHENNFFIDYLIIKNVELNAVDSEGNTPIMLAIQCSNQRVWGPLLEAGADLWEIKNDKGECALWMIFKKFSISSTDFQLAMNETKNRCNSNAEIADALFSAGFQLYNLEIFKEVEITKHMLNRGCAVNLQDVTYDNFTALHIAARRNDLENVKVLLQFGADKNLGNKFGYLPIDELLNKNYHSKIEVLELLLPDVNKWTKFSLLISELAWRVILDSSKVVHSIIFHLLICEARGLTISFRLLNDINASETWKNILLNCKQEFEDLKSKTISGNITYLKFLTCVDYKTYKLVQNEEVVEVLSNIKSDDYFHRFLIKCFEQAMEINLLRKKAKQFICECIEPLNGYNVVLEIILDFLNIEDLKLIAADND